MALKWAPLSQSQFERGKAHYARADFRQRSCAEHSERRGLQGLRDFGAGKLPFIEVRQNSGSWNVAVNVVELVYQIFGRPHDDS